MTIADLAPVIEYLEDGVSVNFPVPFRFLVPEDLTAWRDLGGVQAVLTYGADYYATGGDTDAGGTLVLLATVPGATLHIERHTPLSQDADYQTNDRFPAETHEGVLDKLMAIAQEQDSGIRDISARALRVPPSETIPPFPPAAIRAQSIAGFDGLGNPALFPADVLGSIAVIAQRVEYEATAGQTTFATFAPYIVGYVSVFVNGAKLGNADFTATDGSNVVLELPCEQGDIVSIEAFLGSSLAGDAAGIAFIQSGAGAALRSVESKLRDKVNVRDFYQATDPDWTNAFERAIYTYGPELEALEVEIPPGEYILSRQIIPRRQINIRGAGEMASVLIFQNVTTINPTLFGAFSFATKPTLDAYVPNPNGYPGTSFEFYANGAASSKMSNLQIRLGTGNAAALQAIWSGALICLHHVYCHVGGIYIQAGGLQSNTSVTLTGTNANISDIKHCSVNFAKQDGISIDGSDANIISIQACNVFQPTRYGINDASFLGNHYSACHTDGGVSGYRAINPSNASRTSFHGCYAEGNTSGPTWDCAAGISIINPKGAFPVRDSYKNANVMQSPVSGLWSNFPVNVTSRAEDVYGIGDATHRAARLQEDGLYIRSQDGKLYAIRTTGGAMWIDDGVVNIMQLAKGAAIADVTGGTVVDVQARAAINAILARMRAGTPNIS